MAIELAFEGGKVDDKDDPGGRTCNGITQRTFNAWCGNQSPTVPIRDVWTIAATERDAIYRLQYADKVKFDVLPAGVDLVMLDGAINSGPVQATKWLQRALGPLYGGKIDGILGRSEWLRAFDYDLMPESYILAAVRIMYGFAFGCFFLALLAEDAVVPPNGSYRLLAIVGSASGLTILLMWWV